MAALLLFSVFVIATCGLIYELIAGTVASYLLGDSVTQFSTIIGVYLFAMGIGSWLSRYIEKNLLATFVKIEILVGVIGGCSAAFLFLIFQHVTIFGIPLYLTVLVIGTLVGIEIPLLLRILKDRFEFKDLVSKVFTFDYIGALFASILFPLVMVPYLGLIRSAFMFGMLNVLVALWMLMRLSDEMPLIRLHKLSAICALVFLSFGFIYSEKMMDLAEGQIYPDKVIYSESTKYQRITLTKSSDDLRLFLNGNLQFSTRDEYRYHEALVHPGMAMVPKPKRVLIMGGGDGMAAREVLKYPSIETITQVELDPAMIKMFSENAFLTPLNGNSLHSPKVEVVTADAFIWARNNMNGEKYDFIIADFPDPGNYSVGKLYTNSFYKVLYNMLSDDGVMVIQSTSPFAARKSFWCVNKTLESVGFKAGSYHAYVPSFGEWGFTLGAKKPITLADNYLPGLKFVNAETVKTMFAFPDDMAQLETEVNRLDNQALVRYFDKEWAAYSAY